MRYINAKTKAVVETDCVINGGDWKPLEETKKEVKKTARKSTKKDA